MRVDFVPICGNKRTLLLKQHNRTQLRKERSKITRLRKEQLIQPTLEEWQQTPPHKSLQVMQEIRNQLTESRGSLFKIAKQLNKFTKPKPVGTKLLKQQPNYVAETATSIYKKVKSPKRETFRYPKDEKSLRNRSNPLERELRNKSKLFARQTKVHRFQKSSILTSKSDPYRQKGILLCPVNRAYIGYQHKRDNMNNELRTQYDLGVRPRMKNIHYKLGVWKDKPGLQKSSSYKSCFRKNMKFLRFDLKRSDPTHRSIAHAITTNGISVSAYRLLRDYASQSYVGKHNRSLLRLICRILLSVQRLAA